MSRSIRTHHPSLRAALEYENTFLPSLIIYSIACGAAKENVLDGFQLLFFFSQFYFQRP